MEQGQSVIRRFQRAFVLCVATVVVIAFASVVFADTETTALAVQGRVTIVRAGVGDIVLAPGVVIESGDSLVSDDEGRALVRVADTTLITIGPFTQVQFETDSKIPTDLNIVLLLSGDVRILSRRIENNAPLLVRTKSAELTSRDGYFVARHDRREERTQVLGLSGSVDVSRQGDDRVRYSLTRGLWCAIDSGSSPTIPQPAAEEMASSLKERTNLLYVPAASSQPGNPGNLGDNPLRDIPTKLTGYADGSEVGPGAAAEFEAFPVENQGSPDIPEGLEIDRESDVSLILIFNNLVEKNRPLDKK